MDAAETQILHKNEVSDTTRHDMLPILKYLCIIGFLWTNLNEMFGVEFFGG